MKPPFRHVTVPVDGSTSADRGVRYAIELARRGGSITFCSVVDASALALSGEFGAVVNLGPDIEAMENAAERACRQAQNQAAQAGVTTETIVLNGERVDAIDAFVRRRGSEAIVIGTRTRTDLARHVMRSMAEGLLRASDVPVIVVHEDDVARSGPIAVGYDDSVPAGAALHAAIDIAVARDAGIALLHVSNAAIPQDRTRKLLDDARNRVRASGLDCRIMFLEGRPQDSLLAAAAALGCCAIVLGTHGRPFLQRLVIGSVAAHVVAHAHIPVVAVRGGILSGKPWHRTTVSAPIGPPIRELELDALRT